MAHRKLTEKQEAFARAYVESGNASEAYRSSYNVQPNTKQQSITRKGYQLLNTPHILARIESLHARARERHHDITVDFLTKNLKDAIEIARSKEQPNAMVQAVMALAKLHGMLNDKQEQPTEETVTVVWLNDSK
ncbi:MAG: terminase small subunit [Magnetococcales bacterium]|nr:terminase small subunit [Magnetococcales bacterium]